MKSRGIIKIVSRTGCVYKCRPYHNKEEMMCILEALRYIDEVVKGSRFIHVLPNTELSTEEELELYYVHNLEEPETIFKTKNIFMKVTDVQKGFIQDNMDSLTCHEMSRKIELSKEVIQYWVKKFRREPFVPPVLTLITEVKKDPRPPTQYSNARLYETF